MTRSREATGAHRGGRPARHNLALVVGSVLLTLVMIELGARVVSGNWTDSFLEQKLDLLKGAYPVSYDPELGWVPRAGFSSDRNVWKRKVTITANGLRTNGSSEASRGARPILAVGDSFTFGDEVTDTETWPSHLERRLGRPVLNAGVFAYGLDQTVLRARELVAAVKPEWVIVSFISHDVVRCELSAFGAAKPYFYLQNGELRRGNQPVPPPRPVAQDAFRRVLGHSFVMHTVMGHFARAYWLQGRLRSIQAHGDGEAVAVRLMSSLAADLAARGVRLLVVAQGERDLSPDGEGRLSRSVRSGDRGSAGEGSAEDANLG